jgi:signal transduction histidine kinase
MSFWRQGRRTTTWWIAAALGPALIATDVVGQLHRGVANGQTALFEVAMAIATIAGLWIWAWRPATRMGPLMFWWPATWVAADLDVGFPDYRFVSTFGLLIFGIGPIVFAQMALSYPTGKLTSRLGWAYIFLMGYLAQAIQNVYNALFWDARGCPFCSPRAPTYFHVGAPPFSLDWWNKGWAYEIIAALPFGLYVLYRRYFSSGAGARRTMGPLVATATVVTCTTWVQLFFIVLGDQSPLSNLSYVEDAGLITSALTSFLGLALTRRARGVVGDLVVELGRAGPGGVRSALARAIGDPSLELALWIPGRRAWVDEEGREVSLPEGPDRAVTFIGEDLAAFVHHPVFLDQPAMLEAAGSAVRFALENERLQAALRSQLAELRESRARIVRAGDEERRRLERDLHDGAQQRLLGIGMALQLLRSAGGPDQIESLLDETDAEVQAALHELRELARGIHPAVLTDHGLAAAVRTLAERAVIPVEVDACDERFAGEVETAVYFIVAEALANVAKHARASKASVKVERVNGAVAVEVSDDGIGGATVAGGGTGLRGLADRAGALDGRMRLDSPVGGGTRILVELPCAS